MKWRFDDPTTADSYTFAINPNVMTTPHQLDSLEPGARSAVVPMESNVRAGVARVLQGKRQPLEWSFSGVIREKAQYNAFYQWSRKRTRIQVTDHFGRTWEIRITEFQATEARPSARLKFKFDYTIKAILFRRVA